MTTTDYLSRELRRARLSLHRAEKKPNTPESELHGLRGKITCLEDALAAVQGRCLSGKPLAHGRWSWCSGNKYRCTNCGRHTNVDEVMEEPAYNYCPYCGADMREEESHE